MFWCEHIYVAFSTTYVGYLTLRRKSAYLRRKKISCYCRSRGSAGQLANQPRASSSAGAAALLGWWLGDAAFGIRSWTLGRHAAGWGTYKRHKCTAHTRGASALARAGARCGAWAFGGAQPSECAGAGRSNPAERRPARSGGARRGLCFIFQTSWSGKPRGEGRRRGLSRRGQSPGRARPQGA